MVLNRTNTLLSFVLLLVCLLAVKMSANGKVSPKDTSQETATNSMIHLMQYSDTICSGIKSGFILIEIDSSIEDYYVFWNNGASELFLDQLKSGTYSVSLTKDNNIIETMSVTIAEYPKSEYRINNALTACNTTTSLQITQLDTITDIQSVFWSDGSNDIVRNNVNHGYYSAQITDNFGCPNLVDIHTGYIDTVAPVLKLKTLQYTLGLDGNIPILFPKDFVVSAIDDCSSEVSIFPEQIHLNCSHLGVNSFNVIAVDDHGNITVDSFYINIIDNDAPLIFCPANIKVYSCDTVFYDLPFTVDNCGIESLSVLEGLPSGSVFPDGTSTIVYQVKDKSGNTGTCQMKIIADYGIDYQISSFEASCHSLDDGAIIIHSSGVHAPIQHQVMNYFDDLLSIPAGDYYLKFTDTLGCYVYDTVSVHSPEEIILAELLMIEEGQFDGNNGWIEPIISGGVPPYRFTWYQNGQIISQNSRIENLNSGTYYFKLKDAYQCAYNSEHIVLGHTSASGNENFSPSLNISPNPADRHIFLNHEGNLNIRAAQIYNMSGEYVQDIDINNEDLTTVSTSMLTPAVYFLRLQLDTGTIVKRFVVMH